MPSPVSNTTQTTHAEHAIVPGEADTGRPLLEGNFENMARRRFQEPKPRREGKWWYLIYWQDVFVNGKIKRKRMRKKLAPGDTSAKDARRQASEFLRPTNQGLVSVGSATKFGEYVEGTYKVTILPTMASSTQARYTSVIKNYLNPAFEPMCLRDLTPLTLQRYFSAMLDSKLAYESRDKIRDVMSSILTSAVTYGFLVKNPVEGIRLSRGRMGKRVKPFLEPAQFVSLIDCIPEPYSTMVYVAVFTGLRPSEVIGLRWRNVHSDSISIEEVCVRGVWGAPKSAASSATIPVNASVIDRILRLKGITIEVKAGHAIRSYPAVKSCGPDDLVFASVAKGVAMRDNTILGRYIKPAARKLGLGWVNWQVLRRTHATWLKMAGADVKDAQAQMRHSRVTTTLEIYQQFIPESQRRVVNRLTDLTGPGHVN